MIKVLRQLNSPYYGGTTAAFFRPRYDGGTTENDLLITDLGVILMPPVKLTKKVIDGLPEATNPKGELYFDSRVNGFGIRVYPSGKKSFFIEFGQKGRRRRMAIGAFGVITADQARKKAEMLLAEVLGGKDPLQLRQEDRKAPTFKKWSEEYLEEVRLRKKSAREDERYLKLAQERWGSKLLRDVTTSDVDKMFQHLAKEKSKTTANRWLASVRACLQAAWRVDKIEGNPAMKIRSFPNNPPRQQILNDDEFKRLLEAIDNLEDIFAKAGFHLLVTTGARLSEVLHARWEDVDLKDGLWRIPSTKSGRPQVIPLPKTTVAMIKKLPKASEFIVAGNDEEKPRWDLKRPWKKVQEEAKIQHVTIHDIRRTFGLHVAKRAGLHVASKLLRHSDIRVTEQHYAPLGIEDLRKALEQREADILPLRRKKNR